MLDKTGESRPARLAMFDKLPLRHFKAIVADPPWHFKSYASPNKNPHSRRDVERHYRTLSPEAIKNLPVADYASRDGCHLFLWATGPNLPLALAVIASWGFKYSGVAFTWIKLRRSFDARQLRFVASADGDFHVGLGHTTRKNAEFCLLGRRGNARRERKDIRELILAPVREHSRKPEEARERIERYAAGPYLELFGRDHRDGWTVCGDEVGKFGSAKSQLDLAT